MNNKQGKSFRPSGRLNSVFIWPIALWILLIIVDFALYFIPSGLTIKSRRVHDVNKLLGVYKSPLE